MIDGMSTTRRSFLVSAATAASASRVMGANERVNLVVIGVGGRGTGHVRSYLGLKEQCNVAGICDVNQAARERSSTIVQTAGAPKPKEYNDMREVFADKSVDAVSMATPNHWHALGTVWACQAGKDVYVEKPASHNVWEADRMVDAARKYKRMVQVGTQSRSSAHIKKAAQLMKEGVIGQVYMAKGLCYKRRPSIGRKPDIPVPPGIDWDKFLGPAPMRPFNENRFKYNWHWFWDTGNGDLNNQGTHQLDIAYWALGKKTHPVRAMALGGRFKWNDQGVTPNTMFGIAEYPGGQYVFFNVRNVDFPGYPHQVENEYYFEDGGKIIRDMYYPKGSSSGEKVKVDAGKVTPGGCFGAFIAACRAGNPALANGTMEDAHFSCVVGHLMNNSYRLGEKVPFNAKAGRFGDNKAAAEHFLKLHEMMRDGAGVPEDKESYTVGPWLTFDPQTEKFVGEHAEAANKLVSDPNRKGFEVPDAAKV